MKKIAIVTTYDADDNETNQREIDLNITEFRTWLLKHTYWAISTGHTIEICAKGDAA